jgi:hypothetical protein
MGAVEHLKTLCCLGLSPESAMIAVTPLLHQIIPHGATRMSLLDSDGTIIRGYSDNPAAGAVHREHMWRLMDDPTGFGPLWLPSFHAVGLGWTLHVQSRGWFDSAWYREIERPLDSCWLLDSMVAHAGHTIATVNLTRARTARPFTVDDVQRLDPLRPWLAHAFRRGPAARCSRKGLGLMGRGRSTGTQRSNCLDGRRKGHLSDSKPRTSASNSEGGASQLHAPCASPRISCPCQY